MNMQLWADRSRRVLTSLFITSIVGASCILLSRVAQADELSRTVPADESQQSQVQKKQPTNENPVETAGETPLAAEVVRIQLNRVKVRLAAVDHWREECRKYFQAFSKANGLGGRTEYEQLSPSERANMEALLVQRIGKVNAAGNQSPACLACAKAIAEESHCEGVDLTKPSEICVSHPVAKNCQLSKNLEERIRDLNNPQYSPLPAFWQCGVQNEIDRVTAQVREAAIESSPKVKMFRKYRDEAQSALVAIRAYAPQAGLYVPVEGGTLGWEMRDWVEKNLCGGSQFQEVEDRLYKDLTVLSDKAGNLKVPAGFWNQAAVESDSTPRGTQKAISGPVVKMPHLKLPKGRVRSRSPEEGVIGDKGVRAVPIEPAR